MYRAGLIAVLIAGVCFFASGVYAYTSSTDRVYEVAIEEVMKGSLPEKKYNVTSIMDKDLAREKPELTRVLILLEDGYSLRNMSDALDETETLGRMKLGECCENYSCKTEEIPFCAGFVTLTPIKNKYETIGWILRRDEGVRKVEWWINKGGRVDVAVSYEPILTESESSADGDDAGAASDGGDSGGSGGGGGGDGGDGGAD